MPNVACGHWQRSSAASLPCASASTFQSYYKAAVAKPLRLACSAAFRSTTGTPISFYMLSVPASTEKLTCGMQAATQCCRMCSCFVFWWIIPLLAFTKTFLSCMHKSRTTQHLKLCYKVVKPRALGTFQDWTCVRGDCCVFFIT